MESNVVITEDIKRLILTEDKNAKRLLSLSSAKASMLAQATFGSFTNKDGVLLDRNEYRKVLASTVNMENLRETVLALSLKNSELTDAEIQNACTSVKDSERIAFMGIVKTPIGFSLHLQINGLLISTSNPKFISLVYGSDFVEGDLFPTDFWKFRPEQVANPSKNTQGIARHLVISNTGYNILKEQIEKYRITETAPNPKPNTVTDLD